MTPHTPVAPECKWEQRPGRGAGEVMDIKLIYITAGTLEEAQKIGRTLVEERLVACVNILDNVTSLYWWEGKIQNDREVILIAKTTRNMVRQVIERVKLIHSYACPCIVSFSVDAGNPAFLSWVEMEVRS
ncbi:MAG: divalent-cation tolerance protein CutA [Pseudomonadota bacterium]